VTASAAEIGASESILGHRESLAREITDVLYAGDATLLPRFGEQGRAKCLQDMHYSLEHLAPAVALDDPPLFARYVTWLASLLAARGIDSRDVRRSLEATRAVLAERLRAALPRCRPVLALRRAAGVMTEVAVDWWRVYLEALRAGDRRRALVVVDEARTAGLTLSELYLDVFQPALREIGRLWQENEITVAEEHLATAVTQMSMGSLYTDFCLTTSRNGRTLLAACAETERHEVGLRMICDLLELEGWDATYLGAAVRSLIVAVRAATGDAAPYILVGGRPFLDDPTLGQRVGADAMARDMAGAVARLRERFG
jgi:MerR family transcriptional regulator, light-induced transcriptional regulator